MNAGLLNLRTAALDKNAQHDGKQHTGNDANNGGLIHVESPFFSDRVPCDNFWWKRFELTNEAHETARFVASCGVQAYLTCVRRR